MADIGEPRKEIVVTPEREPVPERIDVPDYPPVEVPEEVPA